MKKYVIGILMALVLSASAQSKGKFLQSHVKQIGDIGPYQVYSLKVRGLDSPNVSAAILYDPRSQTASVIGPATGAGLAGAIVGGAADVGSAAVFGRAIRPDRSSVENYSGSDSEAGVGVRLMNNNPPGKVKSVKPPKVKSVKKPQSVKKVKAPKYK